MEGIDFKSFSKYPNGESLIAIMEEFYSGYLVSVKKSGKDVEAGKQLFESYVEEIHKQIQAPFSFTPYHKKITSPINYAQNGLDFISYLVDWKHSVLLGEDNFRKAEEALERGENVVFLANHQIEPDPQVILYMIRDKFPILANVLTFVAGERVLTDPLAAPFSMGCNLFCIYSKRYVELDPVELDRKKHHNVAATKLLKEKLEEGSLAIYVAPSGGRDRRNDKGDAEVSDFDPKSVEIFRLLAAKSKTKTHFFPLALHTYDLMPPPKEIKKEVGERRITSFVPVGLSCGNEWEFSSLQEGETKDQFRVKQAHQINEQVILQHNELIKRLKGDR